MKFNESLPTLLELLRKNGVPLDENIVIVRDLKGRLIVAKEDISKFPNLAKVVVDTLGRYSAHPPVISGAIAARLLQSKSLLKIKKKEGSVNFLDRRVIGMDWLQEPSDSASGPKRLVFGSLKGGVGRSTALAVLAADLARKGKKVLAIDLDLEAPGIGFMFLPESDDVGLDRRPKYGVVDYLVENSLDGIEDADLYDFIGVSAFGSGSVDVLPAVGRETDLHPESMLAKLTRALVEDEEGGVTVPLAVQLSRMVDRFVARGEYDAVLIDARAGLSEITAAPLISLGAEVFLFGVDQPQTYRGYSYLLSHLALSWSSVEAEKVSAWKERIHFVHAKAPSAASKRAPFRERIYDLCSTFLYDAESLDEGGKVIVGEFMPAPSEEGLGVPHDAFFVLNNADYEAFDPIGDVTQLDVDVYRGPFGAFLDRATALIAEKGEA